MVNSPTPAAARIAFTKASATGLRSTLAIPGRVSSSEEICDPPSSADIELAAPGAKGRAKLHRPYHTVKDFRPIFGGTIAAARGYDAGARPGRARSHPERAARWRGRNGTTARHLAARSGWERARPGLARSEEHTSELQSRLHLVCR